MNKKYNGMNDIIFKNTFYIEKNKDLLKWLIESCLDMKIDELELKDRELIKDNKIIKSKVVDTIIKTNGKVFNVEINNGESEQFIRDRNLGYLASIYSNALNTSENYVLQPISVQINLTSKNNKIHEVSKYMLKSEYGEFWSEKFIIYEFNVDKLKKTYYNKTKVEKERFKPLIMLISSNEELEKLCNGDERVKRYKDRVEELNDDPEYTILMSDEEDDKKLKATREYLEKLRDQEYNEKNKKLDERIKEVEKKEQEVEKKEQEVEKKKQEVEKKEQEVEKKEQEVEKKKQEAEKKKQEVEKDRHKLNKLIEEYELKINELINNKN